MIDIVWEPQPKQREFMAREEYEVLFGGSAGGGKSEALVIEALRQVDIPYYKGLIIRKTFPQLAELIDKSLVYYPRIIKGCQYNASSHTWRFPSGAKIIFGSMQHTTDRIQYQGQAYDFIAFDELTHFTWDEYSYLFSRNRPNGPGTDVYIRATANPGNVGHGWVKERFIAPAPPMTPINEDVTWVTPDGTKEVRTTTRLFVPSSVFDNKVLMENDPDYISRLASLPEAEKNALLYGDWDSFEGQVFLEWRNNPDHYQDRKWTHVIDDLIYIPDTWKIYRGFDFGYSRPFAVLWIAIDHEGRMYHFREFYGCDGTPNHGVKLEPQEVARQIKEIENTDPRLKNRQIYGIADPAIWQATTGESIAAMMERQQVYFEPGDHARLAGKMQVHYRLAFGEDGLPMFYVCKECKNFIRTIPNLVYDDKNVEDVDTDGEDHIYDALKYVCMEHPLNPRHNVKVFTAADPLPPDDPIEMIKESRYYG